MWLFSYYAGPKQLKQFPQAFDCVRFQQDDADTQERAEEVHEEDQEVRPHRRLLHPVRQALCQQQDLRLQRPPGQGGNMSRM